MKSRTTHSHFSLVSFLSFVLFISAINLAGCSAHSLTGPDLDEVSETTQAPSEDPFYGQDPSHNEDPANVETGKGGSGGSIDYMAEHNETNE